MFVRHRESQFLNISSSCSMRIAILTFHRAYNCGAMLQAWALKTVLERLGHIVEFPVCNHVGEEKRWQYDLINPDKRGLQFIRSIIGRGLLNLMSIPSEDISRFRYKKFRKTNFIEHVCEPSEFNKHYDLVVVGSDQVWSVKHTLSEAPVFFAENIPECVRKIAYAASYGDKPLGSEEVKRVAASLDSFSDVSVREPLAQQQLSSLSDKHIDVTLDPTLLLTDSDYEAIEKRSALVKEPYLFLYTLYTAPFFVDTVKALAHRLGVKCVIAPCYQYSRFCAPKGLTYGISPDRLVGWAHGAKYVVAGSFHGTVMGVLFHKPFLSLRAKVDEYESRPAALLNMMGCSNRLVNPKTSIDEMESLLRTDLQSESYAKLTAKRCESLEWLKRAVG